MPKGRSYQADHWLDFEKGPQQFIQQNFAHKKALTFKAKLENENDGVSVSQTLIERPDGVNSSGEVRYWFNLKENNSFYGKVGLDSNLEMIYDHGVKEIKGVYNNFYFGGVFNHTFTERQTFAGLQLFVDGKWSANSKFTFDYSSKAVQVDQKFKYLTGDYKINGFSCFDSLSKAVTKCGLLFGRIPSKDSSCKWNSFLRLEYPSKTEPSSFIRSLISNVTFNLNSSVNQTQTVGIESKVSLSNLFSNIFKGQHKKVINSLWLASEWNLGETVIKAKVSKELSHAISIRNKITYGSYTFGIEATDITIKPKFKFGLKVDLNL